MVDKQRRDIRYYPLVGIEAPIWTGKVAWAMPTIIVIDAWQWTPFVYLILLAGLQSLPLDVMEAARIDGASTWQRFWRITMPLLTPFIYIAALLRFMDALTWVTPRRSPIVIVLIVMAAAYVFIRLEREH